MSQFSEKLREQTRRAIDKQTVEFNNYVADWLSLAKTHCSKASDLCRVEFMFYAPPIVAVYPQDRSAIAKEVQRLLILEGLQVELMQGRGTPQMRISW